MYRDEPLLECCRADTLEWVGCGEIDSKRVLGECRNGKKAAGTVSWAYGCCLREERIQ
jgi:hypothetical protein